MDICEASAFGNQKIDRHPWELARIKVVKDLLAPICAGRSQINILDIGCGDVFVVQELSKCFPTVSFHCIDIAFTDEIKRSLKDRVAGFPISLFSSLEELKATEKVKKADIILLLDVIEHIEDDVSFMKYLGASGFINETTRVVITVPAYQSLFSNHDIYLKHFRRYNLSLLKQNQHKGGFNVIKNGYFFSLLLIPRIIQKLMQGHKSVEEQKGIGQYESKGAIDSFLVWLLYTDYLISKLFRLIGVKIPGLSCFAICQQQ